MTNLMRIILLAGLLLSYGGCKKSDFTEINIEENNFVIAQIDSSTNVMASELYNRLMRSNLLVDGGYLDSSTFFDTLFGLVIDSIASLEAKNVRVEDNYGMYSRYKNDFRKFYVEYLFNKMIIDPIKLDTPQVSEYYQNNLDIFKQPQEYRVSHLMISAYGLRHGDDSVAYADYADDQLDSIAESLLSKYRGRIDSTTSFGELAIQYSMHRTSGEVGGDLGYFKSKTYASEFEAVICTMGVGDISFPFKTRDGWHLAQLTDYMDSITLPLGTVYDLAHQQLLSNLANKASVQLIDSINETADFLFNDSALQIPATLVADSVWAAIINGKDTIDFMGLADYFFGYKRTVRLDSLTLDDLKLSLRRKAGAFLIAQVGDDLGYDKDSSITATREGIYHNYARRIVGSRSTDLGFAPEESAIEEYYNQNINDYIIKKPVNVQHIIVEDSIFGEFLRDQALSGVDFLELAEEHYPGAKEIRVAAADLGYIGAGEMPDEFYYVALRTGKGTVSHPVRTEWGYHIIYVVDKQINKSLEQVQSKIAALLRNKHQLNVRHQWQQDMLAKHTVVYFLDPIKKLRLPPNSERVK